MRWVTVATEDRAEGLRLYQGEYMDVNAADPELPSSVRELLELGPGWERRAWAALPKGVVRHDPANVRLMAPVPDPQKIVCIGLNYRDHAAESGVPVPDEPVLFSKYPTTLIGHRDTIVLPRVSHEVDYEAELVVVIGRGGRQIPRRAGFRACRGLRRRPRRLGPRLAAQQARQAVDGRQDVRHLRPGRARDWSPPTRSPTPTSWASGSGSTARPCRIRTPTSSSSASTR